MSRTYRIRNLPRFTAKKYVDGRAGWDYKRRQKHLEDLVREHYPEFSEVYEKTPYRWSLWSIRWQMERKLETEFRLGAESLLNHPWVSWCRVGSTKKWYKTNGNRSSRHRTRQLLRTMPHDETYDQRRKFDSRRQEVWDIWSIC